jgi:predicted peptidase
MQRRTLLCTGLMALAGLTVTAAGLWEEAAAQPAEWTGGDVNGMHYEVLPPDHYNAATKYPLVLYLHQLDMGNYREGLMKQANGWFNSTAFRSRHPSIIVMPMLDQTNDRGGKLINFGGKNEGHVGEDNAIAALKQVMARYAVDANRIYVTGNSMGGMGTWQMLLDYNARTGSREHIFAAGMPLAGTQRTADPEVAAKALQHVPIWAIHGAHDKEVGLDWDRTMARLMAKDTTFRYTEVADGGHNIWDTYYQRPAVWDWLFSQSAKA